MQIEHSINDTCYSNYQATELVWMGVWVFSALQKTLCRQPAHYTTVSVSMSVISSPAFPGVTNLEETVCSLMLSICSIPFPELCL